MRSRQQQRKLSTMSAASVLHQRTPLSKWLLSYAAASLRLLIAAQCCHTCTAKHNAYVQQRAHPWLCSRSMHV